MLKALDLFCGAGGASMGLYRAGFEVTGVDLFPQNNYPFKFIKQDALKIPLEGYDFIWASPPCQAYSQAQRINNNKHEDLVGDTRQRLVDSGVPWTIENVLGAPLVNPIMLCGTMFDLRLYRHRLFETSFPVDAPPHPAHTAVQCKMGRKPNKDEFIQVVGHFSGMREAREAMGIDWMTRDELKESIPPAYSEFIARHVFSKKGESTHESTSISA